MENKNGSGIFIGVVSVATLIVAIIGATFAYFSASAGSNEDAVNLAAYEFDVKVTNVQRIYPESAVGGIIPLNPSTTVGSTTNLLYALNNATTRCVDDQGYQVCALYKATIANGGTQSVGLNLEVKTTLNDAAKDSEGATKTGRTPFEDLTIQTLDGELDNFTTVNNPVTLMQSAGQSVTVNGFSISVDGGATAEHYFVVYLNEPTESTGETTTGPKDQSAQMGASYQGQLVYTTSSGDGNRLTGTFNFEG